MRVPEDGIELRYQQPGWVRGHCSFTAKKAGNRVMKRRHLPSRPFAPDAHLPRIRRVMRKLRRPGIDNYADGNVALGKLLPEQVHLHLLPGNAAFQSQRRIAGFIGIGVGCGVRFGQWCGRLDRSVIPAGPMAPWRDAQRLAVGQDAWKCSAAREIGQPSSTTRRASNKRPRGVKTALAWTMKVSCSCGEVVAAPLHDRRPSPSTTATACRHTYSTNLPGQYN